MKSLTATTVAEIAVVTVMAKEMERVIAVATEKVKDTEKGTAAAMEKAKDTEADTAVATTRTNKTDSPEGCLYAQNLFCNNTAHPKQLSTSVCNEK